MTEIENKISLKQKILILNGVIISIIASIIFFVVLPSVNEIKDIQNSIQIQYDDLENKYIKGQSLKRLSDNLKKIDPLIEKLDGVFIKESDQVGFITFLENLATENKISQKITLNPPQVNNYYKKIPMQIATNGSYFKQMNFIKKIESLNYYITIKSIEISPSTENGIENSGENVNTDMVMNVDTYWK